MNEPNQARLKGTRRAAGSNVVLAGLLLYLAVPLLPDRSWSLVQLLYSLTLPLGLLVLTLAGVIGAYRRVLSWRQRHSLVRGNRLLVAGIGGIAFHLAVSTLVGMTYRPGGRGQPAPFPFGLQSFESPGAAALTLGSGGDPSIVRHQEYPRKWWLPCPDQRETQLDLGLQTLNGVSGSLVGIFLNDRLYQLMWTVARETAQSGRSGERQLPQWESTDPHVGAFWSDNTLQVRDLRIWSWEAYAYWFCAPPGTEVLAP